MKRIISFLRENPLFVIMSLVAIACYILGDAVAGTMMAAVNVVPGGSPKPSKGIGGLPSQGGGEATTVSNARELGTDFIDADVDDRL